MCKRNSPDKNKKNKASMGGVTETRQIKEERKKEGRMGGVKKYSQIKINLARDV